MNDDALLEALAEKAHIAWAGWMAYLFWKSRHHTDGTVTIPEWAVTRWRRQMGTPYAELSEQELGIQHIHECRHPDLSVIFLHVVSFYPRTPGRTHACTGDRAGLHTD